MASGTRAGSLGDAIIQVMRATNRQMTPNEILQGIERMKLFTFNAKNPASIVSTQLRRHTVGSSTKIATKVKLFERSADGKYFLVE